PTMRSLFTKILGDYNEKALKKIYPIVAEVNSHEETVQSKSDDELRAFALELRERHAQGESLDDLLPESFATTREVARRTLNQRHLDDQVMSGIVIQQRKIDDVGAIEGKTQSDSRFVGLNALPGREVSVITSNDYLARRDVQWMEPIYHALGLTI